MYLAFHKFSKKKKKIDNIIEVENYFYNFSILYFPKIKINLFLFVQ